MPYCIKKENYDWSEQLVSIASHNSIVNKSPKEFCDLNVPKCDYFPDWVDEWDFQFWIMNTNLVPFVIIVNILLISQPTSNMIHLHHAPPEVISASNQKRYNNNLLNLLY